MAESRVVAGAEPHGEVAGARLFCPALITEARMEGAYVPLRSWSRPLRLTKGSATGLLIMWIGISVGVPIILTKGEAKAM